MHAKTLARALLDGERAIAEQFARRLLCLSNDNFVERPWGGSGMLAFKRRESNGVLRIGEAFEIAADDADPEARQYPSILKLDDGSEVSLPALLETHAETLLGSKFVERYGRRFPLLPKTLNVGELLSVQAHPEGNTEVYVIIAAEPGASIRLGFNRDVDPAALGERLSNGRREQQRLLDLAGTAISAQTLQAELQRWLADKHASTDALRAALAPAFGMQWPEAEGLLRALHTLYWDVLDLLNAIPVSAGQVINNANPARVVAATGKPQSAEVHALGNPERRELLALEIRRPGPTFRAWDNVRFPLRDIHVDAALGAVNLSRTTPADFIVEPKEVPGRPGVRRSVESEHFSIEHLAPTALVSIDVPATPPHCLHVLDGAVTVYAAGGDVAGRLARGDSAIVPIGVGAYRIVADTEPANIVKVDVPL